MGAFYRTPNLRSEVLDQLRNSLSKTDVSKVQNIWLAGDLNLSISIGKTRLTSRIV